MKIGRVAALCKKGKWATIYRRDIGTGDPEQYIDVGGAIYYAGELPPMDKQSICAVMDVPENQRTGWTVQISPMPPGIDFSDTAPDETWAELEEIQIVKDGQILQPVTAAGGVLWVNAKYLKPIEDSEELLLTVREMPNGMPYIVIKGGMLLVAVVLPVDVSEKFLGAVAWLANATRPLEKYRHADNYITD